MQFHFQDGIEGHLRTRVRTGLDAADRFLHERFGLTPTDAAVFVGEDSTWLAGRYRDWMSIGNPDARIGGVENMVATPGAVFINLPAALSAEHYTPKAWAARLAHEWFHVLQYELAGVPRDPSLFAGAPSWGPVWLLEGSAEYVALLMRNSRSAESLDATLAAFRSQLGDIPAPLDTMATYEGLLAPGMGYTPGVIAVDRLIGNPDNADVLVEFFATQSDGVGWSEAFTDAFGVTADEFYEDFETRRAAARP